jgi:hypothetical protein
MKPARPYQRLPGRSRQLFNYATLWESDDHLLFVQSHSVAEAYRRFFYRDIQAIVLCGTQTGLVTSIVLGVMAGAFGFWAAFSQTAVAIVLGVLAGVFLLLAIINVIQGPTCRCTLRTAVQTQELPSLNRIRTARRVLSRIQAKVATAQQQRPAA